MTYPMKNQQSRAKADAGVTSISDKKPAKCDTGSPECVLPFRRTGGDAGPAGSKPSSAVPTLGASGAVVAVMGAFLVTYARDRML